LKERSTLVIPGLVAKVTLYDYTYKALQYLPIHLPLSRWSDMPFVCSYT